MIHLQQILSMLMNGFFHLGATKASIGGVNNHIGFADTHHWTVTVLQKGFYHCQIMKSR